MHEINLLPWRAQQRLNRVLTYGKILSVLLVLVLIIFFLLNSYLNYCIKAKKEKNQQLKNQTTFYIAKTKKYRPFVSNYGIYQKKIKTIQLTLRSSKVFSQLLLKIYQLIPHSVFLKQMTLTNKQVVLVGYASSIAGVTKLMQAASKNKAFNSPFLKTAHLKGASPLTSFKMNLFLRK